METMTIDERKRFNELARKVIGVLLVGFAYLIFVSLTGLYIPCPIRLVTGYLCPGCGISHYAVHMAHFEFKEAFMSNRLVFCLVPLAIPYGIWKGYLYVKDGDSDISTWEKIVLPVILIITIMFGIVRNLR